MANFNAKKTSTTLTKNKAGGTAIKESTKLEFVSLLLTSFLSGNKYYENNKDVIERVKSVAEKLLETDKLFLAKASLYARDKYQMRSVSHLVSAIILEDITKGNWSDEEKASAVRYLSRVSMRPDDITEAIACYFAQPDAYRSKKGRLQLPNVAKKGFSSAMADYDEYRFAKYKNSGKEISLLDAVRMVRPKATAKNKEAIVKLLNNQLKNTETWEAKQSAAGKAGAKEDVIKAKKEAWSSFLSKGNKIEYFALLRNLRNILEQCNTDDINTACTLLQSPELISRSKVLPFRYITAYEAVQSAGESIKANKIKRALNRAVEISLANVPKLQGNTAILLDISGSMSSPLSDNSNTSIRDIANLFASVLYRTNDSTVILFNNGAEVLEANPSDSVFTIAKSIPCGGGTNMSAGFGALGDEQYDNIIVLSDMQTWMDNYCCGSSAKREFNNYKKRSGASNCKLFSFDLAGYGTLQFPEENVFLLAGWSEHSFEIMSKMQEDKKYLIHEIESIEL